MIFPHLMQGIEKGATYDDVKKATPGLWGLLFHTFPCSLAPGLQKTGPAFASGQVSREWGRRGLCLGLQILYDGGLFCSYGSSVTYSL